MKHCMRTRRLHSVAGIMFAWCLAITAGCSSSEIAHKTVVQNAEANNGLEFYLTQSRVVDDRFFVADVTTGPRSGRATPFASFSISSVGMTPDRRDLLVVDLDTGRHDRVFNQRFLDDHGFIRTWYEYLSRDNHRTTFAGYLIIDAIPEDTTRDGRIDIADRVSFYAYDLANHKLVELCPAGYTVSQDYRRGDRLILILHKLGTGALAVYEVDPVSGNGRFIADGITP